MYHIAVSFDIPADKREEFIEAAIQNGRNSAAEEPGTQRFELIEDETNPNRFYLDEAYDDEAAFRAHRDGPHFNKFFDTIGEWAEGPTWLIKGNTLK